jgi:hypothetical protein
MATACKQASHCWLLTYSVHVTILKTRLLVVTVLAMSLSMLDCQSDLWVMCQRVAVTWKITSQYTFTTFMIISVYTTNPYEKKITTWERNILFIGVINKGFFLQGEHALLVALQWIHSIQCRHLSVCLKHWWVCVIPTAGDLTDGKSCVFKEITGFALLLFILRLTQNLVTF